MRIGINCTSLGDRPSGARQRLVGLYGALFRLRPDNEYLIYEPRDCRVASWFAGLSNVRGIATPLPSEGRWKRLLSGVPYWNRRLRGDRLDLFEALHLPLTRAPDCPTLLTVHDARPILSDTPALRRAAYREVLDHALRRADHVVTVSDAMRDELLRLEPRARVTTIYNGIDPAPFERATPEPPPPFLLAVGHFEPRKNYAALLRAMALLGSAHPELGLVIVGKDGGTLAETSALVDELQLSSRVRLLTEVDDWGLARLYRSAAMMLFPSTYEGFGIPVLEAMAAGCPPCLSDIPVFRELTEQQGAYFPPRDPSAMAATVDALLAAPQRRQLLVDYGRQRIADFQFPALAAQLDALHRSLAKVHA